VTRNSRSVTARHTSMTVDALVQTGSEPSAVAYGVL